MGFLIICWVEGLHKNYWMDFIEIWWEDGECVREEPIHFGADLDKDIWALHFNKCDGYGSSHWLNLKNVFKTHLGPI